MFLYVVVGITLISQNVARCFIYIYIYIYIYIFVTFEVPRNELCQNNIDFSNYQLNAQLIYSSTIYMLHYTPQHVLSSVMLETC